MKSSPSSSMSHVESPNDPHYRANSGMGHHGHGEQHDGASAEQIFNEASSIAGSTPRESPVVATHGGHSSSGGHPGSRSSSLDRKNTTSLAEDISQIREALEGASSSARERTLKILERLTARLALAESERDRAMCKFQTTFASLINTQPHDFYPQCFSGAEHLPQEVPHGRGRATEEAGRAPGTAAPRRSQCKGAGEGARARAGARA